MLKKDLLLLLMEKK